MEYFVWLKFTASPSIASVVVSCITKYMSAKGANNASSRFNYAANKRHAQKGCSMRYKIKEDKINSLKNNGGMSRLTYGT